MYRQRYPDDPGMHNSGDSRHGSGSSSRTRIERAPTFASRLGGSLCAVVVGVILVPVAITILSWNEYRCVRTAKSLDEALNSVAELHSSQVVITSLNGHLVHLSDRLVCDELLRDSQHGIAVGAVKLKRHVEMYQWIETEHRHETTLANGDKAVTTTYSYDKQWKSEVVRSSSFDNSVLHKNPDSMLMNSETYTQKSATVGTFSLSNNLMDKVTEYHPITPTVLPSDSNSVKLHHEYFYYGNNPTYPEIGDVRVSFSYAGLCKESRLGPAQLVSVMAQQDGDRLTAYQTLAGDTIEMLSLKTQSAEQMIRSSHSSNTALTWLLRALGILLNFIAFSCMSSFTSTLVSWIPFVRELVFTGACMFSLSMAISTSLTTIALSWIVYRPLYAAAILALTLAMIALPRLRSHQHPDYYQAYTTRRPI